MKKYKIGLLVGSGVFLISYFLYHLWICPYKIHYVEGFNGSCYLMRYQNTIWEPLVIITIGVSVISIFTFLVSNTIFKKWLTFTFMWLIFTSIFVALAPEYDYSFFGGPTKELVSIWMSSLFAIISILMFIIMSVRERSQGK